MFSPILVCTDGKAIMVYDSNMGDKNKDIAHTFTGIIILPKDRKKYKKKTSSELVQISEALSYEAIIVEKMKWLRLIRANSKLKKRDDEITLLINQVDEDIWAKSTLEG